MVFEGTPIFRPPKTELRRWLSAGYGSVVLGYDVMPPSPRSRAIARRGR